MEKRGETVKVLEVKEPRHRTLLEGGVPREPAAIPWKIGHASDVRTGGSKADPPPEKYNAKRAGRVREKDTGDGMLQNKEKL